MLPWGPSISVESANRHHNSYQDCVPHGCVRQCAGSFTHATRMTFATALRRWCFHSQVTVREKTHRAGGEEAVFGPPSVRSLGSHELSSSGTPGPGKRTGDVGHLGHDSYSPEAGHPDEFQISATPAVPTAVPRQGCLSAASKYGPKSDTSPSSNQVTSPRVSFSHKVK